MVESVIPVPAVLPAGHHGLGGQEPVRHAAGAGVRADEPAVRAQLHTA